MRLSIVKNLLRRASNIFKVSLQNPRKNNADSGEDILLLKNA
ncbi:hypothetical protein HMPREF9554_01940 [Treponema phagedenis F0421]|nr:hypothetical protein HMPREF9554_01940 [Treponema phagedenis F0421]